MEIHDDPYTQKSLRLDEFWESFICILYIFYVLCLYFIVMIYFAFT